MAGWPTDFFLKSLGLSLQAPATPGTGGRPKEEKHDKNKKKT